MLDQPEDEFGNDEEERLRLFAEFGPCIWRILDVEFQCNSWA